MQIKDVILETHPHQTRSHHCIELQLFSNKNLLQMFTSCLTLFQFLISWQLYIYIPTTRGLEYNIKRSSCSITIKGQSHSFQSNFLEQNVGSAMTIINNVSNKKYELSLWSLHGKPPFAQDLNP